MEMLAQTRIVMWEGASLWLINATPSASRARQETDLHAHHAIQIVLGLGGAFRLRTADREAASLAVAVAADVGHVFEAEGLFALLFVEPESRAGRAMSARLFGDGPLAPVPRPAYDGLARAIGRAPGQIPGNDELVRFGRAMVADLAGERLGDRPDGRVLRMIAAAKDRLEGPVSLSDVVGVGGLSAGRLRHLFVEQTGLPFQTYLLWLRLMKAIESIVAGATLTGAAHDAGFADSAHFSRTFRRMFGVAPASLRMT